VRKFKLLRRWKGIQLCRFAEHGRHVTQQAQTRTWEEYDDDVEVEQPVPTFGEAVAGLATEQWYLTSFPIDASMHLTHSFGKRVALPLSDCKQC
jgi:hypothetical protein